MTRLVPFLAVLGLLVGATARAAPDGPLPFDAEKAAAAALVTDPAAATSAYLDAVPAERRAKTKSYARGNYVLDGVDTAWEVLVYAALLGFGVSARLRDRAERLFRRKSLQVAAYFAPFFVLTALLSFPFVLYRRYFREKAYGLLTQGFPDWLLDRAKALGLGVV